MSNSWYAQHDPMHVESKLAWEHNRLLGSIAMAGTTMNWIEASATTTAAQKVLAALILQQLLKLDYLMRQHRLDASGRQVVRKPKTRKTK